MIRRNGIERQRERLAAMLAHVHRSPHHRLVLGEANAEIRDRRALGIAQDEIALRTRIVHWQVEVVAGNGK
jgi:hypothetical protein